MISTCTLNIVYHNVRNTTNKTIGRFTMYPPVKIMFKKWNIKK